MLAILYKLMNFSNCGLMMTDDRECEKGKDHRIIHQRIWIMHLPNESLTATHKSIDHLKRKENGYLAYFQMKYCHSNMCTCFIII